MQYNYPMTPHVRWSVLKGRVVTLHAPIGAILLPIISFNETSEKYFNTQQARAEGWYLAGSAIAPTLSAPGNLGRYLFSTQSARQFS